MAQDGQAPRERKPRGRRRQQQAPTPAADEEDGSEYPADMDGGAPPRPEPPVGGAVGGDSGDGDGDKDNCGAPTLEGMFTTSGSRFFNPGEILVTGSTKPEEFLARTNITQKEWMRKKRIIATLNYRRTGRINLELLLWMDMLISPAFDGEARRQLVEITNGRQAFDLVRRGMQQVESSRGVPREKQI